MGRAIVALVDGAILGMEHPLAAQDYPSRPVQIIAPSAPGGGFDLVGRILADGLSGQFGRPFVVENRTGGGTLIGTQAAAVAAADGYTLLVGGLSNIALNPALQKKACATAPATLRRSVWR